MHFASAFDDNYAAETLLLAGAEVNARSTSGFCAYARLPYADSDQVAAGCTSLHHAADGGNLRMVERLLKSGTDPAVADDAGVVPLMFAGNGEIVRVLLDRGLRIDVADNLDCQPVHYAAREGRLSAMRALFASGADLYALTSTRAGHTVRT